MARTPSLPVRLLLSVLGAFAGAAGAASPPTLADVQGVWWRDCDQPAAEFGIDGEAFYGDFEGRFRARVERGVLRVDALDSDAPALAWRIVAATPARLVLRARPAGAAPAADWTLRRCPEAAPALAR
ncbi:hypothetical protein PRJ39_22175 [Lysobacter enzymogenes]|uniref:hypothetical protein n=1 Tax=Lysobacter enzymogenes TaxID=69 RepID=UPI0037489C9E